MQYVASYASMFSQSQQYIRDINACPQCLYSSISVGLNSSYYFVLFFVYFFLQKIYLKENSRQFFFKLILIVIPL